MNDNERFLEKLGQAIAESAGTAAEEERIQRHKLAFVRHVTGPEVAPGPRWRPALLWAGASASVLLVLGTLLVLWSRPGDLPFHVEGGLITGELGAEWQVPPGRTVPVHFADGSAFALTGPWTGQLRESSAKRVQFELQSGKLTGVVVSGKIRKWTVRAGPYRITDLGTRFSVVWEPEKPHLRVDVFQGAVEVKGPGMAPQGSILKADDFLVVDPQGRVFLNQAPSPASETRSAVEPPAEAPVFRREKPDRKPRQPAVAPPQGPRRKDTREQARAELPRPGGGGPLPGMSFGASPRPFEASLDDKWRRLCEAGRYQEAIAEARAVGFQRLLAQLHLEDLWMLSEAARYVEADEEEKLTLQAVRRRFPATWHSRVAAFLLGRHAAEKAGNPKEAISWFQQYLMEEPAGSLAQEALGRLLGLLRRAGQQAEAARAARLYLERHPDGLFAREARATLNP